MISHDGDLQIDDEKMLFESVFNNIPGIIVLLDEQGKMLRWNRTVERISGYFATEIANMNCADFFLGEEAIRVTQAFSTAIRIGCAEVEADIVNRDGSRHAYYFKAIPMRINNRIHVTGVGVDISQRRLMETELRSHRDSLESMVQDRTAELSAANQELTAMNEEINAVNQELQAANQLLLLREQQYRAAAHLLTQPVEEAAGQLLQILQDAMNMVSAPTGFIGVIDETRQVMVRRHSIGPIDFVNMQPQPANQGMVAQVLQSGEIHYVEDYRHYARKLSDSNLHDLTTVLMVPLKQGNKVKGILAVHWMESIHSLPSEDIEALRKYCDLVSAVLERTVVHAEMRYLAYHDSLTGMENRTSLNQWLEEELAKSRYGKSSGGLLFIDLDELKVVNDTFGHSLGDELIIQAGLSIREAVGEESFCARIGGDEFVVVLSGYTDRQSLSAKAEQLLRLLGKGFLIGAEQIPMSASIGIVLYPGDGGTVDDILKNADRAMYAAKGSGRNCWRFYEPSLQREEYENMMLTNCLRRAIERSELTVLYQPKMRLVDETVAGFEALLRWKNPEHGVISPDRFIPLAEKSGLIVPIGRWVLQQSCRLARELADRGKGEIRIAVNISPRQLIEVDFISAVFQILSGAGIAAGQLELEVTESVMIENMEESIAKLEALHCGGVYIALDDFGTGFSSLTYLRRLPVDTLKVDKTFIDDILNDDTQAALIGFIVDMAHTLDLVVVAEGVENREQLEKLREHECDLIQGYVFSRPLPEEEVFGLLGLS